MRPDITWKFVSPVREIPKDKSRGTGRLEPKRDCNSALATDSLGSNDRLSEASLRWFSAFPDPALLCTPLLLVTPASRRRRRNNGTQQPPRSTSTSTINQVTAFVICLAEHWHSLLRLCRARRCPLLVDELAGILCCSSPTLQVKLFAASLGSIGRPGGPRSTATAAVWNIFKADMAASRLITRGRGSMEQKMAFIAGFNRNRMGDYQCALGAVEPPTVINLTAED